LAPVRSVYLDDLGINLKPRRQMATTINGGLARSVLLATSEAVPYAWLASSSGAMALSLVACSEGGDEPIQAYLMKSERSAGRPEPVRDN